MKINNINNINKKGVKRGQKGQNEPPKWIVLWENEKTQGTI